MPKFINEIPFKSVIMLFLMKDFNESNVALESHNNTRTALFIQCIVWPQMMDELFFVKYQIVCAQFRALQCLIWLVFQFDTRWNSKSVYVSICWTTTNRMLKVIRKKKLKNVKQKKNKKKKTKQKLFERREKKQTKSQ